MTRRPRPTSVRPLPSVCPRMQEDGIRSGIPVSRLVSRTPRGRHSAGPVPALRPRGQGDGVRSGKTVSRFVSRTPRGRHSAGPADGSVCTHHLIASFWHFAPADSGLQGTIHGARTRGLPSRASAKKTRSGGVVPGLAAVRTSGRCASPDNPRSGPRAGSSLATKGLTHPAHTSGPRPDVAGARTARFPGEAVRPATQRRAVRSGSGPKPVPCTHRSPTSPRFLWGRWASSASPEGAPALARDGRGRDGRHIRRTHPLNTHTRD